MSLVQHTGRLHPNICLQHCLLHSSMHQLTCCCGCVCAAQGRNPTLGADTETVDLHPAARACGMARSSLHTPFAQHHQQHQQHGAPGSSSSTMVSPFLEAALAPSVAALLLDTNRLEAGWMPSSSSRSSRAHMIGSSHNSPGGQQQQQHLRQHSSDDVFEPLGPPPHSRGVNHRDQDPQQVRCSDSWW